MKSFVLLGHVCRVFLAIGIASLSILMAVAAITLTPPRLAHADSICPPGTYVMGETKRHKPICSGHDTLDSKDCPPGQKPDPDSPGCIPDNWSCGSASTLDDNNVCEYNEKTYLDGRFGPGNIESTNGYSDVSGGNCPDET